MAVVAGLDVRRARRRIREEEPHRFEPAALRWLARFCVERREATLAEVQAAALACEKLADKPTRALDTL